MKKLLAALIVALVLLCAGWALAENGSRPTDPYLERVYEVSLESESLQEVSKPKRLLQNIKTYLSSGPVVFDSGVTEVGDYYTGHTWYVNPVGGSGSYTYEFYIGEQKSRFGNSNVFYHQKSTSANSLTYQFQVPGYFYFLCYVTDSYGQTTYYRKDFTVYAGSHQTLSGRVQELVSQCRAAGCYSDFDTALWLHDWLMNHNYYDLSYHYYSAADALLRGTCVCDGYSKAYFLLLEAAGISVDRVLSDEINHAWNVAKLDGQWYQIDVTWDDPSGAYTAVSGSEQHLYFGLPDELMTSDHGNYDSPVACTAYADNYFIRTGKVDMWLDPIKDKLFERLNASMWCSLLDVPDSYAIEKSGYYGWGNEPIVYGVTAYRMSHADWSVGGELLRLNATYREDDRQFYVTVRTEDNQLKLPAALRRIAEYSFEGNPNVMGVVIPEGVTSIGPGAFANCPRLWAVHVPASVTSIASDAFSGSPHVNIVCPSGSYAQQYAVNRGLPRATY